MLQGVTILQVEAIPTTDLVKSLSLKPTALNIERLGALSGPSTTTEEYFLVSAFTFVFFFWKNQNPSVRNWSKQRLEILYDNNISLYACHLPLDRHKVVGNNAQILKLIGAKTCDEFMYVASKNVGWIGKFNNSKDINRIEKILADKLSAECTVLPFGPKRIKTVAVCSGGAGYSGFYEALEAKVDLLITGDAVEVYYSAKDASINIIFAGHHNTETIGLRALSRVVSKKFHIETAFIDLPTGL